MYNFESFKILFYFCVAPWTNPALRRNLMFQVQPYLEKFTETFDLSAASASTVAVQITAVLSGFGTISYIRMYLCYRCNALELLWFHKYCIFLLFPASGWWGCSACSWTNPGGSTVQWSVRHTQKSRSEFDQGGGGQGGKKACLFTFLLEWKGTNIGVKKQGDPESIF